MRHVLDTVQSQANGLMVYSPERIVTPVANADRYYKYTPSENAVLSSAIAFIRACLDIMRSSSFLLSAKAILAARLAANILPKSSRHYLYIQSVRDELAMSRTRLLKQLDQAMLHANPLEALQSYAFVTGSSPSQVLQRLLSARLASTRAALSVSSPDSLTILHVIRSIKSTITDVRSLFPFTFQRTMHDLKSTSLLSQPDLRRNLQRRRGNIELWIQPNIRKFLAWTKSETLDDTQVDKMLHSWMDDVDTILKESAGGLFIGIQELDVLCRLRAEIISALDDDTTFEERLRGVLIREIAGQITRLMTLRVQRIHQLEDIAREIIEGFKGMCFDVC
jgi:hypothetical protein